MDRIAVLEKRIAALEQANANKTRQIAYLFGYLTGIEGVARGRIATLKGMHETYRKSGAESTAALNLVVGVSTLIEGELSALQAIGRARRPLNRNIRQRGHADALKFLTSPGKVTEPASE